MKKGTSKPSMKKYADGGISPRKEARLTRRSDKLTGKLQGIKQNIKSAEAELSNQSTKGPGFDMTQRDPQIYLDQQSRKKARVEKRLGNVNEKLGKTRDGQKLYEAKKGGSVKRKK
jgi:phage shock protein A